MLSQVRHRPKRCHRRLHHHTTSILSALALPHEDHHRHHRHLLQLIRLTLISSPLVTSTTWKTKLNLNCRFLKATIDQLTYDAKQQPKNIVQFAQKDSCHQKLLEFQTRHIIMTVSEIIIILVEEKPLCFTAVLYSSSSSSSSFQTLISDVTERIPFILSHHIRSGCNLIMHPKS